MFKNQVKTAVLLASLMGILLLIGQYFGGPQGLTFALIFGLGINFVMFWWSDKIVLKMYRAKEADRHHHKKLYDMIQDICQRAHLPMPKVFIVPGNHPNAFATGRSPQKAVVAFTEGILHLLNDHELKGVAAHELSHVKNRDTLISTIAAGIAGVISYAAMMARWGAMFGGFGRDSDSGSNIIELLALAILAPVMAMIIQMAISRSREFIADETGARMLKDGSGLASALLKLEKGISHAPLKPQGQTEATAHLFLEHPFRGVGMFKIFSTHPATKERVKRLHSLKF